MPRARDDLQTLRRIALKLGLGAPYLCDGTCDTCDCAAWEADDWCDIGQCPAGECECDMCAPPGVDALGEEEAER